MVSRLTRAIAQCTLLVYLLSLNPLLYAEGVGEISDNFEKKEVFTYVVTPEEDHYIEFEDVTVEIPAGSVDKKIKLTIEKLGSVHSLNEGLENTTRAAAGYRFGPHPYTFNNSIKITLPYAEKVNRSKAALSDLKMQFYNEEYNCWEGLPTIYVNSDRSLITGMTNHFTDMITSTLTLPESPEPINFDPNSIKDLEAADPGALVPEIKGLEASAFGGGSFSIPLRLPAGRGKATPQLALSYNVNSANSWMGKGFDISVPSITTDTRFGLPEYDGYDTYMLNGQELVPTDDSIDTGEMEYVLKSEGSFQQIIRYREYTDSDSLGEDYWIITDKSGTSNYYGYDDAYTGISETKIFTWYLKKTVDANGNTVLYEYDQTENYTYLSSINWTCHDSDSDSGPYWAVFNRTSRDDQRSDARGGYISTLDELLSSISLYYGSDVSSGTLFRAYEFSYSPNIFGQNQLNSYSETDGDEELYSYDFGYSTIETDDDGNFKGFESETWSDSPTKALNDTTSFGLGATLSIDIGFKFFEFYRWGIRKGWVWRIGLNAGASFSNSWQTSDLMDLNGDGLPDMVWQSGESLIGRANTGTSFDDSNIKMTGFEPIMGSGYQSSYNMGASVTVAVATIGIGYQNSSSHQKTSFADVNGDGYVDVVKANSSQYYLNNTTAGSSMAESDTTAYFSGEDWEDWSVDDGTGIDYTPSVGLTADQEANYYKSYYIETPVRRWKAYKPGTVTVTHEMELNNPSTESSDGVKAIVDYSQTDDSGELLDYTAYEVTSSSSDVSFDDEVSVDRDQEFFFLLDPGSNTGDNSKYDDIVIDGDDPTFVDDLVWSTSIAYETIGFFDGDPQKQAYFDSESTSKAEMLLDAQSGAFVPLYLTTDDFQSLYFYDEDNETDEYDEITYDYTSENQIILQTMYEYDETLDLFALRDIEEGGTFDEEVYDLLTWCLHRLLPKVFTTPEKLLDIAFGDLDGETIIWSDQNDGAVMYFEKSTQTESTLYNSTEDYSLRVEGSSFEDGSLFIDRIYYDSSDEDSYLDIYMDSDNSVLIQNSSGEETGTAESVSYSDNTLSFEYDETTFSYEIDYDYYPKKVFEEYYTSEVKEEVLSDEEITLFPHKELSSNYYSGLISLTSDDGETLAQLLEDISEIEGEIESLNTQLAGADSATAIELQNQIDDLQDIDYPSAVTAYNALYEEIRPYEDLYELSGGYYQLVTPSNYTPTPSEYADDTESYDYNSDYLLVLARLTQDITTYEDSEFIGFDQDSNDTTTLGFLNLSDTNQLLLTDEAGLSSDYILSGTHDETSYTYIDPLLLETDYSDIVESLEFYRAFSELFPYYEDNGEGYYVVIDSLDSDGESTITTVFEALSLNIASDITINYSYDSTQTFTVHHDGEFVASDVTENDTLLSSDDTEEETYLAVMPVNTLDDETAGIADGDNYDYIQLIRTEEGKAFYDRYPLLIFDSGEDYSTAGKSSFFTEVEVEDGDDVEIYLYIKDEDDNLTLFYSDLSDYVGETDISPLYAYAVEDEDSESDEEDSNEEIDREGYFAGGYRNWTYGIWSSYYEWDSELIGTESYDSATTEVTQDETTGEYSEVTEADVLDPPYMVAASLNEEEEELDDETTTTVISVEAEGFESYELTMDTWIGSKSDYSASNTYLNDDGIAVIDYTDYEFAPYITNDNIWHPMRVNGPSFYYSEAYKGTSDDSEDNGAPFTMGKISQSTSEGISVSGGVSIAGIGLSLSYTSGDSHGYKNFMDINGDRYPDIITMSGGDLSAFYGSANGFTGGNVYESSFSKLNYFENETNTYSSSITAGGSNEDTKYSDEGRPKQVTPVLNSQSDNVSLSLNVSQTDTTQKNGLMDINGDGLPDHVKINDEDGNYSVKINCGDDFEDVDDWINESGYDLSSSSASGLGGSFGGGVSVIGLSAGLNGNANSTEFQVMDINGDGLPDQVEKKSVEDEDTGLAYFNVRFNRGNNFADPVKVYCNPWGYDTETYQSELTQDITNLTKTDINGMDVTDSVDTDAIDVSDLEANNPIDDGLSPFSINDTLTSSSGISLTLGASVSISFDIWLFSFTITPGVNGTYAESNTSMMIRDMNGDGAPEHIFKRPASSDLYLRVNKMADVGILETISLPQGGSYDLSFERTTNSQNDPHSRRILTQVIRHDGDNTTVNSSETVVDGDYHSYGVSYSYSNPFYDRVTRDFYGFSQIITIPLQYVAEDEYDYVNDMVIVKQYNNNDYAHKGKLTSETHYSKLEDDDTSSPYDDDSEYMYHEYTYVESDSPPADEATYVYLESETITQTDTDTGSSGYGNTIVTTKTYDYDSYGNIVELNSTITGAPESQNYDLYIGYETIDDAYIMNLPNSLICEDGTGELIRKRTAEYDSKGNLITLNQYYADSEYDYLTTSLGYDEKYGNLTSVTDPTNYITAYTYGDQNQFVVQIDNYKSGHTDDTYTSSMAWDKSLGVEISRTEINGNTIERTYDSFGRLTAVITDYDDVDNPAVSYTYDTTDTNWRAITSNKVSFDQSNTETIETVITIDGLGRVIQTAKEGVVSDEEGNKTRGWNKSGALYYDEKGRTYKEGQTQFEANDYSTPLSSSDYPEETEMVNETTTTFDEQGRPVLVELPYDNATISTAYSLVPVSLEGADLLSESDENHQLVTQTDPEGNITEIYKNGRGHIAAIVKKDSTGIVQTEMNYNYNLLGELLQTSDYLGNSVLFEYDLLGRTLSQSSPDAGEQVFTYDDTGLLINKKDSNLTELGKSISYEYDNHNRLLTVDYPYSEDLTYEYGDDEALNNKGRLSSVTNGTTTTSYQYGKLGEITQMTRTIDRMESYADDVSATFQYQSDYLGRMEEITYPDGEVLTYSYDEGGQITGATGERLGESFPYVEDIGYDEYGQRVYIKYNSENGTETTYTYDAQTRRLENLQTIKGSKTYQDINYSFDTVGNILSMTNDTYNHTTEQSYTYDSLYQLESVTGDYSLHKSGNSTTWTSSYTQTYSYDNIGNMESKVSSEIQSPNLGDTDLDYDYSYTYYEDSPHQAEIIGNMYYTYDANGNTTEARMGGHSEEAETETANYTYYENDVTKADQAFGWYYNSDDEEDDTAYTMDFTWDEENRLTKTEDTYHTTYYAYDHEGERSIKYSDLGETLYFDSMWTATDNNTDGSLRRTKNIYIGETRIASKMNFEDASTDYEEIHTYYYHTDHLGSSNVVTDYEGEVYEHLEYTPYGETWIHDQNEDDLGLVDYYFTSKEYDEETGLYYMSARYMNPVASRWVSSDPAGWSLVNPMDGKGNLRSGFSIVESQNPYSYSSNNPINYRDPTGLDDIADLAAAEAAANQVEYRIIVTRGVGENYDYGNDTVTIEKNGEIVGTYGGAQSEKNMKSGNQKKESERFEPGETGGLPDATLPESEDYIVTLLDSTGSYDDPLSITSDVAQLPGTGEKGIKKGWFFLVHQFTPRGKNKKDVGFSLGCQMLPDAEFKRFRKDLESFGFTTGDSLPMSIRQARTTFIEEE
ncbi:MAG: SpvB/TcaC N-terminal domain-containing protein [Spirochaetales bacterium]|nr:SpvB/TcaC N-terminal domain-containing protein [Spirochaetales bacterium]